MTPQMQQTLFVQNPRPTLQEALDFVDNQVNQVQRKQTLYTALKRQKNRNLSIVGSVMEITGEICVLLTRAPSAAKNAGSLDT